MTEHGGDAETGERRDDADGTGRGRGSFWTSLPGVLTGIAAIMAASGTLVGAILLISQNCNPSPTSTAARGDLHLSTLPVGFGRVSLGQGSATMITLSNRGQGKATVNSVTLAGVDTGDFKVVDDNCSGISLPANSSCLVHVAFGPRTVGDKSAALRFDADNADRPPDVELSGTAFGVAFITFDPSTVSINLTTLNGSSPPTTETKAVTISNTGTANLRIGSVLLDDASRHFAIAQSQCDRQTLSPGQTCQITVRFTATTLGQAYNARLLVYDDVVGSPQPIALSGYRASVVIHFSFP